MNVYKSLVAFGVSATFAVSVTALGISLTHAGPRGEMGRTGAQGPVGKTGTAGTAAKNADTSQLGVCISYTTNTTGGSTVTWVSDIETPVAQNGVRSCLTGSFVPVTPTANN